MPARAREDARPFVIPSSEEQQDFLALHREIHGRCMAYAERHMGRDEAFDLVAEMMVILWERWATLSPAQRNDRYAFGILRHGIKARKREGRKFVGLDEAELELEVWSARAHEDAIREGEAAERQARIAEIREQVLASMPARRREVLLLVLEHDLSYSEAAAVLGLNKGTIAQAMRLALGTLRAACTRAGLKGTTAAPRLPSPKGDTTND